MTDANEEFRARLTSHIHDILADEGGLAKLVSNRKALRPDVLVSRPVPATQAFDEGGVGSQVESDKLAAEFIAEERSRGALSVIFQDPWSKYGDEAIKDREYLLLASGHLNYVFDLNALPEDIFGHVRENHVSYQKIGFLSKMSRADVLSQIDASQGEFNDAVANSVCAVLLSAFDDEGWVVAQLA